MTEMQKAIKAEFKTPFMTRNAINLKEAVSEHSLQAGKWVVEWQRQNSFYENLCEVTGYEPIGNAGKTEEKVLKENFGSVHGWIQLIARTNAEISNLKELRELYDTNDHLLVKLQKTRELRQDMMAHLAAAIS